MTTRISPLVLDALDHGDPVVGLETGIITHALPRPMNLETALAAEKQLTDAGVVPASIGMIDGDAVVGLSVAELERLATNDVARIAIRDLPIAEVKGLDGGVSLAATIHLAHRTGIRVVATTGLGGVHRAHNGAALEESSDLTALASHPVVLVSSGVRPMLDLNATLERLETMSVPVIGYRTNVFPGYYIADSGFKIDHQVQDAAEIAQIAKARDVLGLNQALLIGNPIDTGKQLSHYDEFLSQATDIASQYADGGEDDTQILLISFEEATDGENWQVKRRMYARNVALAAEIAKAMSTTPRYTD